MAGEHFDRDINCSRIFDSLRITKTSGKARKVRIDWYRLLPQYRHQDSTTDWEWDKLLNEILDDVKFIKLDVYTSKLDGVEIWTSNWPYAYGALYGHSSGLPSVKTRKRLKAAIEEAKKDALADYIQKIRNK